MYRHQRRKRIKYLLILIGITLIVTGCHEIPKKCDEYYSELTDLISFLELIKDEPNLIRFYPVFWALMIIRKLGQI